MAHADAVLADDELMTTVYEAFGEAPSAEPQPCRRGAPAEVVLRLLILKHVRNWS
jgi:IS5 family transposase